MGKKKPTKKPTKKAPKKTSKKKDSKRFSKYTPPASTIGYDKINYGD